MKVFRKNRLLLVITIRIYKPLYFLDISSCCKEYKTSINFPKDECSLHDIASSTCQMDPHKAKLMRYIKNKDDKHLQLHH